MKRRVTHKKENNERWLVTYADLITLLMIFFIILYTLSRIDVAKFQNLSISMSKAMGAGGAVLDSPGPSVVPGVAGSVHDSSIQSVENQKMENAKKELERIIKQSNLNAKVSVTSEERGVVLSFQGEVLFELGSAELTFRARQIIGEVGSVLEELPNYIRVEGHTDNLPISNTPYPSNWELSAARANSVLQMLIKSFGIHPQRMSAVAYGEYRPIVPNDSDFNRQTNRRVNIVILYSKYAATEAAGTHRMTSGQ